jgi:xanthine dehydrogenase YagS FAD-binding subunit
MMPFIYERASDPSAAVHAASSGHAHFIAGGTTLLDLMKLGAMQPDILVDINDLQSRYGKIEPTPRELRLGALVRMSQAGEHPAIKRDYPVISESLLLAASAQLRNMASLGGNVLQRTRCEYFRNPAWPACNKRNPGSGCGALDGVNRQHAILGVSEACISAYQGDFAQALVALDATVHTAGPRGSRIIPFEKLHTDASNPHIETVLEPGELIVEYRIPAGPWTRRSAYVKVRDRQSYEYDVATAAVALELQNGSVRNVRIGLGAVAYKPWRAHEAEAVLTGKTFDEALANQAAGAAFAHVSVRQQNAYKIELGKRTLVRALMQAASMEA